MDRAFREWAPPAPLVGCVEAIWSRCAPGPSPVALSILPDGAMDLLYRYPEAQSGGGVLLIAGPDRTARSFSPPVGHSFVGLRFRPAQARRVLDLDPTDLLDAGTVPAATVPRLAVLEQRLRAAPDSQELLRVLATGVGAIAAATEHLSPPRRVRAAIAELRAPWPRIDLVAGRLGLAPRTLHREMVAWTGLPPKHLARIFRMQVALRQVRADTAPLASIALAAGYADQAHMAREFRALAAAPPSHFR